MVVENQTYDMFKTENRILFEMLANASDKNKMLGVLKVHAHYGEVDESSAKAILGILNVKVDLAKIMKKDETGREVYDMCKAFEDYKEDGRREGKKEGELMALKAVIKNLMKNQKVSFEEAAKMAGISKSKQKKLMTLI